MDTLGAPYWLVVIALTYKRDHLALTWEGSRKEVGVYSDAVTTDAAAWLEDVDAWVLVR